MKNKEYILNVNNDDIQDNNVFLATNNEGYLTIIIKSSQNSNLSNTVVNNNLTVRTNVILNDYLNTHLIICNFKGEKIEQHFNVIFEYLFSYIVKPINAEEILVLIDSLEEIFGVTSGITIQNQIGLVGELLTISFLIDNDIDNIMDYYHRSSSSKFDFEFSSKLKLEVKTTIGENRIHSFRHNQLTNSDYEIYVSSVIINKSENGLSIIDLINNIKSKTIDSLLVLYLLKLELSITLSKTPTVLYFDYDSTYDSINFYASKDIPKIYTLIPENISNVSYSVDLSNLESLSNFVKLIK